MYAQVVVLTYQSPEIDSYTYEVPKKLKGSIKSGQLVEVPFGKRNPAGIVLNTSREIRNSKFEIRNLKEISKILLYEPILLAYQIKLLKWMTFYYHAPMVNCLEAITPEIPKRLAGYQAIGLSGQYLRGEDAFERVDHSIGQRPRTFGGLKEHLIASEKVSEQKRIPQTLVLVPTINRLPETLAKFPQAKNYAIYHGELKTSEKFSTWQKILGGRIDFVFGSRSAIFTPCPKLSKIIIFDEHDGAYKDERSPYFDTLTIAEKLGQILKAKIEIVDSSPKIATYFSHQKEMQIPKMKVPTTLVSMIDERNKGNRTAISDLLSTLLAKTLRQKKKTLLFLNKKSESGQIYCKVCHFHEFAPKPPQVCPNCQSQDFYFNLLNIWSLAQTVKQIVPKASINLIAEGIRHPTSDIRHPTIDIATASVFYRLSAQKYNLVAHILTDAALNIADFNSAEKTFAQITALKNLAAKDGRLILQTYNTDHPVIKNAAKSNFLSYFAKSLSERKALSFPPFALLIKLTIKEKDKETLEKKAEKLVQEFKQLPTTHYPLRPPAPTRNRGEQSEASPLPTIHYQLSTLPPLLSFTDSCLKNTIW